MSAHRDDHLDLCAGYALGSLTADELREFQAHLDSGCDVCAAELRELESATSLLASAAPPQRAPEALRARVLDAFKAEMSAGDADRPVVRAPRAPLPMPERARPSAFGWTWAAAAAVLAVLGFMQWQGAQTLKTQLAAEKVERAKLEQRLADEHAWAQLPSAPGAQRVVLAPTPDGEPSLVAQVTYDPASHRALVVCENFTAPSGRDYELWAIRGSGPVSLGTVRADANGRVVIRLEDAGGPDTLAAFAVSLEPAGGAVNKSAPGGPVVMVGKVGG